MNSQNRKYFTKAMLENELSQMKSTNDAIPLKALLQRFSQAELQIKDASALYIG